MKKILILISIVACLPVVARAGTPQLSGYWEFNERMLTKSSNVPFSDMFSRLRLRIHEDINDHLSAHVSGDFRLYGRTGVIDMQGLSDPGAAYHVDATLWEAWFGLYDLVDGLEIKIGKQRIAWGTADKLNPTDNLNPYDLSDIFDMWEHTPTLAVKVSYTVNDYFGFDAIWEPAAKPVLLPRDKSLQGIFTQYMQAQFTGNMGMMNGMTLKGMDTVQPDVKIHAPRYDLKHSVEGAKVRGTIGPVDYSVSYIHGWDSIPLVTNVDIAVHPDPKLKKTLDLDSIEADGKLFEYHMAGADLAWEMAGMGWWLEGAVFFPTGRVDTKINLSTNPKLPPAPITTITALPDKPWFNLTAGFDYNFDCNLYLNFQYAHGLFVEMGDEKNINDYFMLHLEQKLLYDKLILSLTGMFGIMDWSDIPGNYTWTVVPEVKWAPFDSVELAIGGFIVDTRGEGFFTAIKDLDTVYLKTKVSF